MTRIRFENVYITELFHNIDQKRVQLGMDCVLPLTRTEQKLFVELVKLGMVRHEWKTVLEKGIFLLMSTLHLCGILLADFLLYWLLSIVEFIDQHDLEIEGECHTMRRQ